MAFNVDALAAYTEQNEALLVTDSVLGAKTAALIKSAGNVMIGVKSAETINTTSRTSYWNTLSRGTYWKH